MSLHDTIWKLGSAIGNLADALITKATNDFETNKPKLDAFLQQATKDIETKTKELKDGNS